MINIIGHRRKYFTVSASLVVISLILLFTIGLKPGIDFTGGSNLEIRFTENRPGVTQIQEALKDQNLGNIVVQPVNEDSFYIKTRFLTEEEHVNTVKTLRDKFTADSEENNSGIQVTVDGKAIDPALVGIQTENNEINSGPRIIEESFTTIGPSISSQLRNRALEATLLVVIAIALYIAYTFRKVSKPVSSWKYGIAAIVALIHDITITVGVFVLLGKYFGVEVDIPFVVALLTILGYSVNDTIIVFDRIREKIIRGRAKSFEEEVNDGVNETISRSINTSATVLIVLVAMYLFGGDSIKYFALALIVGITAGTYSSIFLASPILVTWDNFDRSRRHRA